MVSMAMSGGGGKNGFGRFGAREDTDVGDAVAVVGVDGEAEFGGHEERGAFSAPHLEQGTQYGLDPGMQIGRHSALHQFSFDVLAVESFEGHFEVGFGRYERLCRHTGMLPRRFG